MTSIHHNADYDDSCPYYETFLLFICTVSFHYNRLLLMCLLWNSFTDPIKQRSRFDHIYHSTIRSKEELVVLP